MNLVTLYGNVVRDPITTSIEKADGRKTLVTNFTIAVVRYFRKTNGEKDKDVTFVECEAWDSGAEVLSKSVTKGCPLLITGSLKNDNWEKDGIKHQKLKVRVKEFKFTDHNYTQDE